MRRTKILVAVVALLGSMLAGTAQAGKPTPISDGVNPHIIADGTYLEVSTYDRLNGQLYIVWKVAGLGKYGQGQLRIRGEINMAVTCTYTRGNSTTRETSRVRDIRINANPIYGDRSGNVTGRWDLRPNAVCTNRGVVESVVGTWSGLGVDLYGQSGAYIESRELEGCLEFAGGSCP